MNKNYAMHIAALAVIYAATIPLNTALKSHFVKPAKEEDMIQRMFGGLRGLVADWAFMKAEEYDIIKEAADGAAAVICWGSCASNGCIQASKPNPTSATPIHKIISGNPLIKVPGCPPIAEVMAGTIVHYLTFERIPQLDGLGRPKAFYSRRVHDTCYRRPNYDAGLFVDSFDDEHARQGYCLYKMGCRGPVTYNACGVMRWNDRA